jgi:hypothetical protein
VSLPTELPPKPNPQSCVQLQAEPIADMGIFAQETIAHFHRLIFLKPNGLNNRSMAQGE